jgi:hypothetical protein
LSASWLGQEPAYQLSDKTNVFAGHRAVVGQFERQTGFVSNLKNKVSKGFAHRVQICFSADGMTAETVSPDLRNVDVNCDLPQTALAHQTFQERRVFQKSLAVGH